MIPFSNLLTLVTFIIIPDADSTLFTLMFVVKAGLVTTLSDGSSTIVGSSLKKKDGMEGINIGERGSFPTRVQNAGVKW